MNKKLVIEVVADIPNEEDQIDFYATVVSAVDLMLTLAGFGCETAFQSKLEEEDRE